MKLPFGLPVPPPAPVRPPSRAALALLLATTALALTPHLLRQPLWLGATTGALLLWRAALLMRGAAVPGLALRATLSVALIVLILLQYQTIFGRTAGSAMLVAFAGLKILETNSTRDAMFGNILVAVVVVAGFLFDQSPGSAAFGMACLLLIIANFGMLVAPGRVSARGALRLTARIVLHGVPLAIVAYVLFPRIEGSLWGIAPEPDAAVTGLADHIEPGSVARLLRDDSVAFRIDFNGDAPARARLYWRVHVLDRFDGRRWTASARANAVTTPRVVDATGRVDYEVVLEETDRPWLPVLELPLSIEAPNRLDVTAIARAPRAVRERYRYRATSALAGGFETGPPSVVDTRPYAGVSSEIVALARRLDSGDGAWSMATRILAMFREQPFYYTLAPPPAGNEPVRDFLFDSRRGYCEHYASAFATLMRASGHPARVVAGYQGGEYNPSGNYTIVRQSDAHAWAEIYLDGRGWVRVDPTAAVSPERIDLGTDALRRLDDALGLGGDLTAERIRQALRLGWLDARLKQMTLWSDALTFQWNTWVMAYGPEQQRRLLLALGVNAPDWTWMILALVASSAAFMLITYVALSVPGRRQETPQKHFRRFKRKLARAGLPAVSTEGPRDLALRAAAAFPEHTGEILAIGAEYAALVYAPAGRAELKSLRRRVHRLSLARADTGTTQR